MSGSAGQLRVPVGYLRQTVMPVAPTAEQRRIVARVDELFAEIAEGEAALRRARKGLDTWRRALLKAAVTGELTRDWREAHRPKETGSQLLDRIKATRGNSIRQSTRQHLTPDIPIEPSDSLPEIPEGWCWVNWGAVGISQNGRAFPSQEYCDSGVKLLRPGNLFSDGSIRWTNQNTRYLPDNFLSANRDLIVTEYELVINLTAQSLKDEFLGRVCFTSAGEFCLLNQRLARLTPIVISSEFMLLVFKSAIFRRFVSKLNTGSLIQHMFTSQINRFVFPLPPKEEQEVIVTKLNVGLGGIAELEAIIDDQRNTALLSRQSILKAAFEGRLVPQDADGEPASMLLARSRENAPPQTTARRRGQRIAPPQPSLPGLSNGSTQARRQ